jgi:hypothetical protein
MLPLASAADNHRRFCARGQHVARLRVGLRASKTQNCGLAIDAGAIIRMLPHGV